MIASFLITLREVIEASLIVVTILGILTKLHQKNNIRTVWTATAAAAALCVILLGVGSLLGIRMQEVYSGTIEEVTEGLLMSISALFITWAVFSLHSYFARYKTHLLVKIRETIDLDAKHSLFWLVFTAVFREGFEIVLFLSTVFFSSNPVSIFTGFAGGFIGGIVLSVGLFTATIRLPIRTAFRATSMLLILFAAGLFSRGIHEFAEAGFLPKLNSITLSFIPAKATIAGDIIKAVFGVTRTMDHLQLAAYCTYIALMVWQIFLKKEPVRPPQVAQ